RVITGPGRAGSGVPAGRGEGGHGGPSGAFRDWTRAPSARDRATTTAPGPARRGSAEAELLVGLDGLVPRARGVVGPVGLDPGDRVRHRGVDREVVRALERRDVHRGSALGEDLAGGR